MLLIWGSSHGPVPSHNQALVFEAACTKLRDVLDFQVAKCLCCIDGLVLLQSLAGVGSLRLQADIIFEASR